jgi:hypothetical protein
MPRGLSTRFTLLLVALAFGLTFVVAALLSGGSAPARTATAEGSTAVVAGPPDTEPDLRLVSAGTVPALREPRAPRKRHVAARKPKHVARKVVTAAPRAQPVVPVATAAPAPAATATPAPHHVPPAPRSTPVPKPKPTPAPPSGEFDTSGEP